jgi:hypothetical protein
VESPDIILKLETLLTIQTKLSKYSPSGVSQKTFWKILTIYFPARYNWNIIENGVKHYNSNPNYLFASCKMYFMEKLFFFILYIVSAVPIQDH